MKSKKGKLSYADAMVESLRELAIEKLKEKESKQLKRE
jgi:hypothetical protein